MRRLVALSMAIASVALGQEAPRGKKIGLGVFLTASVPEGDERFRVGEALAKQLSEKLGREVAARSFAKWEDFERAAADGQIDAAVVESFAAAESKAVYPVLGQSSLEGEERPRWAVITQGPSSVVALKRKRLAVIKGVGAQEDKFVRNVVFAGDLPQNHFTLVPVPSIESALKVLDAGSAEAALVPLSKVPQGATVVYRSPRLPAPVAVYVRGSQDTLKRAFAALPAVPPLGGFVPRADPLPELKRLVRSGPSHLPTLTESTTFHLDFRPAIRDHVPPPVLPNFLDSFDVPVEQPDP